MIRTRLLAASAAALAVGIVACESSQSPTNVAASAARAGFDQPGTHRQYGPAVKVGNGTVRTYIVLDEKSGRTPVEVGVAMSETSLDGLPAGVPMTPEDMASGAMPNMHMYLLDLPTQNPTQYKFVQFDWNPLGHEPAGVYDVPHFDFHFYTVPKDVRAGMLPSDPAFATKAASLPGADYRMPFYVDQASALGAPAAAVTVPQMGLHWMDVRSPELQGLVGNPAGFKPFTTTFLYGSYDGQFIFDEPMITRAYILAKHDATDAAVQNEVIPVPTAQRYSPAGFYPSAYRIAYDPQAKEYRIALTQLSGKNR